MTQITILNQNNVPQGPFTRAEVAHKLLSGEFTPSSLAFVEGLSQWTPLGDVLAKIDAVTPPAGAAMVPAPAILPPNVQRYSYAATMQPPPHLVYAGFWLRFVAYFIDSMIVNAVVFGLVFVVAMIVGVIAGATGSKFQSKDWNNDSATAGMIVLELVVWLFFFVAIWLYFALMESSAWQSTLGKRALGLRVTNLEGQRIGFGQASGRYFGKIVSGMTLLFGYIMAGFTERKQALHDMLAGTLVTRE